MSWHIGAFPVTTSYTVTWSILYTPSINESGQLTIASTLMSVSTAVKNHCLVVDYIKNYTDNVDLYVSASTGNGDLIQVRNVSGVVQIGLTKDPEGDTVHYECRKVINRVTW